MKKSQYIFAVLVAMSIGSILFLPNRVTNRSLIKMREVEADMSWKSSLLNTLVEQVQELEQNKRDIGASLEAHEALQAKSLDQMDLMKNEQKQLETKLAQVNTTKIQRLENENARIGSALEVLEAASFNQMDLIKKQQEQLQIVNTELDAMKQQQQQQQQRWDNNNDHSEASVKSNETDRNLARMLKNGDIQYILGVSTGHAGSTTAHRVLGKAGCPWKHKDKFELREPNFDVKLALPSVLQKKKNESDICAYTRDELVPYLDGQRKGATWIDMGHFHNRGPILECLASILGPKILFVRIRRNRHDIANSFDRVTKTPCYTFTPEQHKKIENKQRKDGEKRQNPAVSYCPLETTTPVSLQVNHDTWNKLTSFQQFLWTADELEMRFHNLQTTYPNSQYLEMTWSNSQEFTKSLQEVRTQLGCENYFEDAPNVQNHVKHGAGTKNCTNFVSQDLVYRTLTQYSDQQKQVLFHKHPQPVNMDECMETEEELRNIILSSSSSSELQNWVYKSTS